MSATQAGAAWPELPAAAAWQDTLDTLHMYAQIAGKVRLRLSPPEPQWANCPLYVNARGLTSGPVPAAPGRYFQMDFDLIAHEFRVDTSDGKRWTLELAPRTVKDFYAAVMRALQSLGIDVSIRAIPDEVADPIPFEQDTTHRSYVTADVSRFFQALVCVDQAMNAFRAPFAGRHSRVSFYWGTFDLAYLRFSGRPAQPPPGVNKIMRESMNAQAMEVGFWFGDGRYPKPAFFGFAYPKPDGLERAAVMPDGAGWSEKLGEFLVAYDVVRAAPDPQAAAIAFFESVYQAAARLGGW